MTTILFVWSFINECSIKNNYLQCPQVCTRSLSNNVAYENVDHFLTNIYNAVVGSKFKKQTVAR